jgi:cytochrome c oxidase subunit 2
MAWVRERHMRYPQRNWILLFFGLSLAACARQGTPSTLQPAGPAATEIARLSWSFFGLGTAIYLAVIAFLVYALFRSRRRTSDDENYPHQKDATNVVILGGVLMPAVTLVTVFGLTLYTFRQVAPPAAETAGQTIQVIGHQWWWEVRYPDTTTVTANEIHIPAGEPVRLQLETEDVVHSFWVPELHGKLDMIPNQVNYLWIQADQPGQYRGLCAEFCGTQHAKMAFLVIAHPPDGFAEWLVHESEPAAAITDPLAQEGETLFMSLACARCHAVRGTAATGQLGPDLTHFGSRQTLAAATLANTPENLAQWLLDPDHAKPGSLMPATHLSEEQLDALVTYLESLQ